MIVDGADEQVLVDAAFVCRHDEMMGDDVGLLIYNPLVDLQEEMRARVCVCVSEKWGRTRER